MDMERTNEFRELFRKDPAVANLVEEQRTLAIRHRTVNDRLTEAQRNLERKMSRELASHAPGRDMPDDEDGPTTEKTPRMKELERNMEILRQMMKMENTEFFKKLDRIGDELKALRESRLESFRRGYMERFMSTGDKSTPAVEDDGFWRLGYEMAENTATMAGKPRDGMDSRPKSECQVKVSGSSVTVEKWISEKLLLRVTAELDGRSMDSMKGMSGDAGSVADGILTAVRNGDIIPTTVSVLGPSLNYFVHFHKSGNGGFNVTAGNVKGPNDMKTAKSRSDATRLASSFIADPRKTMRSIRESMGHTQEH